MQRDRMGIFKKAFPNNYKAYFPNLLPIKDINSSSFQELIKEIEFLKLSFFNDEDYWPWIKDYFSDKDIITVFTKKESLLSSQIEGTQSSLIEIIKNNGKTTNNMNIREVDNYFRALEYGISQIENPNGLPLCSRLLKEIHKILMTNVRGGESKNTPGEFRVSQNWIGGTNPNDAIFVPPPHEEILSLMSNLDQYINEESTENDLIKCAIIHYQFETIHPFCDGNGRVGRILIMLYLISRNIIDSPIVPISLYFKKYRQTYYDCLSIVRDAGDIERWIKFFLEGMFVSIESLIKITDQIRINGNNFNEIMKILEEGCENI